MIRTIIDCDTGIDDSVAILFALRHPEIHVEGITTGCGNTSVDQATENVLRLLKLAGLPYEIPVAKGAGQPLEGTWDGPVVRVHGSNGIGGIELPPSEQRPLDEPASDFIVRMARENPGELTVITLGRMTNLALALQKELALPKLVKNVVSMGGVIYGAGNTSPVAEANIAGDPEAADQVIMAGFDLTMVGLDVTMKTRITRQRLEFLRAHCSASNRCVVDYLHGALEYYLGYYRTQDFAFDHCPVHDPLAVLVAINPGLVSLKKLPTRIECGGQYCRGKVVVDERPHHFDAPFVTHCLEVAGDWAAEELLSAFM